MAAVVTIAVVVAGLVSVGLVRGAAQDEARKALRSKADLVTAVLEASRPVDITPALRVVRQQDTPVAWEGAGGTAGRRRAGPHGIPAAAAGRARRSSGSHTLRIDGRSVLVEVRPLVHRRDRRLRAAGEPRDRPEPAAAQPGAAGAGHRAGPRGPGVGALRATAGRATAQHRRCRPPDGVGRAVGAGRARGARRRWPRRGSRSTRSPRRWSTANGGSASSCCRSRTSCARRSAR